MLSPLWVLLFFPILASTTLLVPHCRRASLLKLSQGLPSSAGSFLSRSPSGSSLSALIAPLEQVRGFFALPDSLESCIPAPLFRVSLRRRLRMPSWTQDTSCTLCGEVMDQWGDHALVCGCGGDRVTRHNMIRNVAHSAANHQASLGAVLGKPGLLLLHDPSLDDRPPGPDPPDPFFPCRRPADVWVPRGPSGGQEAWDFSITSALRLGPAVPDPAAFPTVFSSVESRKKDESVCSGGHFFLPLGH